MFFSLIYRPENLSDFNNFVIKLSLLEPTTILDVIAQVLLHSGPSSGNRQNIDSLHYSLTPYDSNLPKISEITKKISFIAHQLKIWRSFKFSGNRWFLTRVFLKFGHFSSDQILDHIRKNVKNLKHYH